MKDKYIMLNDALKSAPLFTTRNIRIYMRYFLPIKISHYSASSHLTIHSISNSTMARNTVTEVL